MGAFSGPKIVEDGLVLALDSANYKSFKGSAATNLLFNISNTYSTTDTSTFKVSYGDVIENIPELGYKSVRYCNIYNDYNGGSGQCCPSPLRYGGNVLGQNITVSPSTTYTYQIIYKVKSGYTNANYMYRYEYNGGTYVTEGGVHNTNNRTSLGNDWWFAWGQFTTQSTTNNLWLAGMWYYQYGVYDTIYVAGVSLHQGTNIIPAKFMLTPQENRGTTVATGGGWADLTGNGNHGELVNGVRESSDNLGALVFDGTNDRINLPFSSVFDISGSMTMEGFIYPTAYKSGGGGGGMLITKVGSYYSELQSDGKIRAYFYDLNSPGYHVSNGTAPLNTWTHFAVVRDVSASTIVFYLNGVLDRTVSSITGNIRVQQSYYLTLGSYNGSGYEYTGRISNAKLYNRALTASEIQQNFQALRGRYGI